MAKGSSKAEKEELLRQVVRQDEIFTTLSNSPMFQLSLSSKELFHSNFLYWVAVSYHEQFGDFLENLTGKQILSNSSSWTPKREYKNLDFCIVDNNSKKIIFALENKTKSIATEEQLKKYNKLLDNETTRVLLSLTTPPFKREDWSHVDYKQLHEALLALKITDCYHKSIIKDYCEYIKKLINIAGKWTEYADPVQKYFLIDEDTAKFDMLMQELRIHDGFEKYRYACMANELEKYLKDNFPSFAAELDKSKDEPKKEKLADCDFGMSNGQGLFEVWFTIPNTDNKLKIHLQVQGQQYRHAIENKQERKATDEKIQKCWEEIKKEYACWFGENAIVKGNAIFENKEEYFSGKRQEFCKYNSSSYLFLYQYKELKSDAKIQDIVAAVAEDIVAIYEELTKEQPKDTASN